MTVSASLFFDLQVGVGVVFGDAQHALASVPEGRIGQVVVQEADDSRGVFGRGTGWSWCARHDLTGLVGFNGERAGGGCCRCAHPSGDGTPASARDGASVWPPFTPLWRHLGHRRLLCRGS